MKIKVIQRDATEHTRTRPKELQRVTQNADPKFHPFERAREYTRAVAAVKTQRMFAKPFVRALDGHRDSVYVMAKHPNKMTLMASGSADGEVRLWDISSGDCVYQIEHAHRGFVRGIAINGKGQILSAGDDCVIKLWDVNSPTWIPQLDRYDSDDDDEVDEALDIMRDVEEDGDSDEPKSRSVSLSSRKQKEAKKRLENRPVHDMDVDEETGVHARRHGAAAYQSAGVLRNDGKPIQTWLNKTPFSAISHKWSRSAGNENAELLTGTTFATSATDGVYVWDYHRSEPTSKLVWSDMSPDSFLTCVFNPVEHDLLASTASDRSMAFFDLRAKTPVRKMTMRRNSNALAWNPMEAFNFTVASEDHNLYTFDMRKLDIALNVHVDHVGAVLDVDYSPTGREFVSGSYDKTIRIFKTDQGHSRDVYHTKRMQRVFCVRYTLDSAYVISASDDANIRLWKSDAHSLDGVAAPRQRQKIYYQNQLVSRYKHLPEIAKISKKRHLPKDIQVIARTKRVMHGSAKRKLENVRAHAAEGSVPYVPERRKHIITEHQ
jgi:WD repeat and SOF domain-containing protein 1